MSEALPPRANLEHLKKQAKGLLAKHRGKDRKSKLADAQRMIARKYGFASWAKLKAHVAASENVDPLKLAKDAFEVDDAKTLRKLLHEYPQLKDVVNQPIAPFDSPPIVCVRSKEMLDVLLDAGADINDRSRWWAGSFGLLDGIDPELAPYAIKQGAIVTVHAAARLGMMDRLKELIKNDPELMHARGGDGQTPLHFAKTVEIAEFLLEKGADIDARDVDHESTPAQWMIRERQDVARLLVRRGCRTDILMAAALGDLGLVKKHLDENPESIRMSVSEKYFPKQNPRAGGTIYIWTLGHNQTPHLVARQFGHEKVFRFLIERSPLELRLAQAYELGDEETFKALLARRPDVAKNLSDDERRKLVDAAQNNNTRAVKLMLEAGWPVDARGQHAGTALHWAAWHGNAAMVREVLRYKPPIEDAENEFKATPLGWATHGSENGWYCKTGNYAEVVEMLLNAGAKIPQKISG
ncbi:MAG TPA: ankyrin repeat domain-containing protein, partial [Tepidisphaeraceae bacterium]|nr:ankyrin repeat domain-containing protein [Tepidisphaeraceae bacterium]